jgi:hypothetical protein
VIHVALLFNSIPQGTSKPLNRASLAKVLFQASNLALVLPPGAASAELAIIWSAAANSTFEHVFEGRIGNESAVPIGLTVDLDGREARRQSTARHDVLRTDRLGGRVEILHIAGQHLHGSDAHPYQSRIQQIEIDELEQRGFKRLSIVDANRLRRALRHDHCRRNSWLKETGHAADGGKRGAGFVENPTRVVIDAKRPSDEPAGNALPELAQP